MTTPLTVYVDSSALIYSGCIRKLYLTIVEGRKPRLNSNDTEWGQAFHKFRAHIREYGISEMMEATTKAVEYYRNTKMDIKKPNLTENYLKIACALYAQEYMQTPHSDNIRPIIDASNGRPLLEAKFSIPYHVSEKLILMLAGTIDEVGRIKDGATCIVDCKTSGAWDKDDHQFSYTLSNQMLFYLMVVRMYGKLFPDSVYGDIVERQWPVGIVIDGVYTQKKEMPELARSRVEFVPGWTLDEYERMATRKLNYIVEYLESYPHDNLEVLPEREGILTGACHRFKQCEYFNSCAAPDIVSQRMLLDNFFPRSEYNPLKFQD